jgi:hypothetical protein
VTAAAEATPHHSPQAVAMAQAATVQVKPPGIPALVQPPVPEELPQARLPASGSPAAQYRQDEQERREEPQEEAREENSALKQAPPREEAQLRQQPAPLAMWQVFRQLELPGFRAQLQ